MGVFRSVVLAVAKYNKDPKTDTKIGGLFAEAEILIDSKVVWPYLLEIVPDKRGYVWKIWSLCCKDDDSDYLENFKHLQMHRRTRALRQLVTKTEDEELEITGATLRSLVLPIADRSELHVLDFFRPRAHFFNHVLTFFNHVLDFNHMWVEYCFVLIRVLFNPDLRSHTELVTAAMDAIAVISAKQTLAGYLKIFDSYVEFDVTKV